MKIYTLSDIHINETSYAMFIEAFKKLDFEIELLLIAGDISNDHQLSIKFIKELNQIIKTYYVPGNHDFYNSSLIGSHEVFKLFENDENCLLNKRIKLNEDYDLVGHIGWYDYSYGDSLMYSTKEFDTMTIDNRSWNDINYIDFGVDNQTLSAKFNDQIESLLSMSDRKTILITHMLSNPRFKTIVDPNRGSIGFYNAFLGSNDLYLMTKNYNVSHAICGHVHYRIELFEDNIQYVCPCLNIDKIDVLDDILMNLKQALTQLKL